MTASGLHDRLLKVELVFCGGFFHWELGRQSSQRKVSYEVSITNRSFFPFLDGGEKTNDLNLLWQPSRGGESISGEDKRLSSSPWRALLDCLAAEG